MSENGWRRWTWRAGAAGASLAVLLAACSADSEPGAVVAGEQARDAAMDSVRAVDAASAEYARLSPGIPVRVRAFRREGADHVVTFFPGGDWVGGGAVIRVKRDGSVVVEEESQ